MPKKGNPANRARGKPPSAKPAETPERPESRAFPIVGIGASAGGLEAFTKLLQKLPVDTGMAFVLIQHLDPTHESILSSLLSRATILPVHEVTNETRLQPNHVYVIPPNADMTVADSMLRLTKRRGAQERHAPVDRFFQSLAESQKEKAIGVILSGTASDGTAGLRAIKAEGGITFVQDPSSARFDGMPRSAMAAGVVDFVLPPEEIARELARLSRHQLRIAPADEDEFSRIFATLRLRTGADFSSYKRGTIERRTRRRMMMRKIDKLRDYAQLLQSDQSELAALYEDLLISVTEFFRDAKTFEILKTELFPQLLADRPPDSPIRIWVAGCSTGEEVYSIAMSLIDFLSQRGDSYTLQVFGTDISGSAIAKARLGVYPEGSTANVPPDFLKRFFTKLEHRYRISKLVRDVCIFARQDLTKDPPFSRVDLISCRNVLIYLGPDLQSRVAPIFHYALKPEGFLLLGSSETLAPSDLFTVVNKNHRIYQKKNGAGRQALAFARGNALVAPRPDPVQPKVEYDLQKDVDWLLISKYAPPGVAVDESQQIVQFRGNMSPYLQPVAGAASLNLFTMLRRDILPDVRSGVELAKKTGDPIRIENLETAKEDGGSRHFNLEILPVEPRGDRKRLFLILFETVPPPDKTIAEPEKLGPKARRRAESAEIARLKHDLVALKEHQQYLIDERQASEEELRSANEEILSSNEELQSTNEELETSQEELQSSNEELTTVNDELHHRNVELARVGADLNNLLNSVNIPIVMLDQALRVRRVTPTAERVLNLRPIDVGRPIMEINSNLDVPDLESLLARVLRELAPIERDVQDKSGAWYSMRIRPYRTEDQKIDGAVLALYDVDALKRSLQEVREARDFSRAIVETVPRPIVVLDTDLKVLIANRAFYDSFQLDPNAAEGRVLYDLPGAGWKNSQLRTNLARMLSKRGTLDFEMEGDFERAGKTILQLQGAMLDLGSNDKGANHKGAEKRRIMLLTLRDVTAEKQASATLEKSLQHAESSLRESAEDLRQSRGELRALAARLLSTQEEERRRVSRELHDDLNQKLAMLEVDVERLSQRIPPSAAMGAEVQSLRRRVAEVSNDIRRVAYQLHPSVLDHLGLAVALRSYCAEFSKREGIQVKLSGNDLTEPVPEEVALCLYRITQESLWNVAKHASAKSAKVTLDALDHRVHLSIRDNGVGFDPAAKRDGGIGLLSMKERVRLVNGKLTLTSKPGKGTRIDVWAPLAKEPS